jgi:hypothetical protein
MSSGSSGRVGRSVLVGCGRQLAGTETMAITQGYARVG